MAKTVVLPVRPVRGGLNRGMGDDSQLVARLPWPTRQAAVHDRILVGT